MQTTKRGAAANFLALATTHRCNYDLRLAGLLTTRALIKEKPASRVAVTHVELKHFAAAEASRKIDALISSVFAIVDERAADLY